MPLTLQVPFTSQGPGVCDPTNTVGVPPLVDPPALHH